MGFLHCIEAARRPSRFRFVDHVDGFLGDEVTDLA
jgi:hypothetical protein